MTAENDGIRLSALIESQEIPILLQEIHQRDVSEQLSGLERAIGECASLTSKTYTVRGQEEIRYSAVGDEENLSAASLIDFTTNMLFTYANTDALPAAIAIFDAVGQLPSANRLLYLRKFKELIKVDEKIHSTTYIEQILPELVLKILPELVEKSDKPEDVKMNLDTFVKKTKEEFEKHKNYRYNPNEISYEAWYGSTGPSVTEQAIIDAAINVASARRNGTSYKQAAAVAIADLFPVFPTIMARHGKLGVETSDYVAIFIPEGTGYQKVKVSLNSTTAPFLMEVFNHANLAATGDAKTKKFGRALRENYDL